MLRRKKADILIFNAEEVVTCVGDSSFPKKGKEFNKLMVFKNGGLATAGDKILTVGATDNIQKQIDEGAIDAGSAEIVDAKGKIILPGFVDCHTHLVFAGSRHEEYREKIAGSTYEEIAAKGTDAGILSTVRKTREVTKKDLIEKALKDLNTALKYGTTTMEVKSGYGLYFNDEIRILEAIKDISLGHPMTIIPTFLAHVFPEEVKCGEWSRDLYIEEIFKDILIRAKKFDLAEYCDAFCDKLAFNLDETREILTTAQKLGFKLKLHAEQTSNFGGASLAAEFKATSADHLDYIGRKGIRDMAEADVIGVLLPAVTFHLMEMIPNPKNGWKIPKTFLPATVKKMIDSGLAIALATDYNPGSSPCLSMQMVMQCAARLYRMNPAQIINAATINAAHAIGMGNEIGSLEAGKKADIIICDCPSHEILIDAFGTNLVEKVIKDGKIFK